MADESTRSEVQATPEGLNRRDFLKLMGTGLGILAVTSLTGGEKVEAAPAKVPQKWDAETDIVIVGYGAAGASAAITAHDAGAKVIVLEKMPEAYKGGTTKVSGNEFLSFTDAEAAKKYFRALSQGKDSDVSDEYLDAWAREMVAVAPYMESFGIKLGPSGVHQPEFPAMPGHEAVRTYTVGGGPGTRGTIFETLAAAVEQKRHIQVQYETSALQLVWDGKKVQGVIAEKAGRKMSIRAKKAVLLTCGGFVYNKAMQNTYLGYNFYGIGNPGNTGDGITMALSVGADLWHMTSIAGPWVCAHIPELKFPFGELGAFTVAVRGTNYFYVDKYGSRWINEFIENPHGKGIHDPWFAYDIERKDYSRIPGWLIFDEAARAAGPLGRVGSSNKNNLFGFQGWTGVYEWSKDNLAEIERGWVLKGQTVEELAANMAKDPETHIDPATLKETFDTYMTAVSTGKDTQFHRPASKMTPMSGPFYAIKIVPGVLNTQGGPRRNPKAQVVDPQGEPISHLYAAGELGAPYNWLYNGGGNIGEAIAFGRVAARNAVAEK